MINSSTLTHLRALKLNALAEGLELQAGQPEHVRRLQSEAMGVEIGEFTGLPPITAKPSAKLSPT